MSAPHSFLSIRGALAGAAARAVVVGLVQYVVSTLYYRVPEAYLKLPLGFGENRFVDVTVRHLLLVDMAFLLVALTRALRPASLVARYGAFALAAVVLYVCGWTAVDPPTGKVLVAAALLAPLATFSLWPLEVTSSGEDAS